MKILGIIPARGGSKGIPGKNIKLLGEKPLIAYTIEQALQSKLLSRVIVSSDDLEIIETASAYGASVPFTRPEMLAEDTSTSIAVVKHAIDFLEAQGEYYDAICLLQPTSPFRPKGFIDEAIATFTAHKNDALVSVLPVPHQYNPHWVFEEEGPILRIATGEKEIITRRQDLPLSYFRDGAIYITKTEFIKQDTLFGEKLGYIISNPDFYVNIDTMQDWQIAEQKLPAILPQL